MVYVIHIYIKYVLYVKVNDVVLLDVNCELGKQRRQYQDSSDEDYLLSMSSDSDYIGSSDEGNPYKFYYSCKYNLLTRHN